MTPTERFWSLINRDQKDISQIYLYAVFNGLVNLTLPLGIQTIINFIQMGQVSVSWVLLVTFVLVGIAVSGLLQILQLKIVEHLQQKIFARSAFEFSYRIPKIRLDLIDNIHLPEYVNRFFDTLTIQKGLPKILIDFSLATFTVAFGLLLLAFYSPYFIALGFVLAFMVWVFMKLTAKRGLKTSLKESKVKYKMAHWIEEIARTNKSFRLSSNKEYHLQRTDEIVESYLVERQSHFAVLIKQFEYFVIFKVVLAAGLLLLGGFLVFQQEMNIGQFVAAEIVILLIINSVEKIIQIIETIYDVLTGLDKIGAFTDFELNDYEGSQTLKEDDGLDIKFDSVTFQFSGLKKPIFDKLDLSVPSNSKVLVTGKPGSGKSVLMHLLSGLLSPNSGEVLINDVSISNYKFRSLHRSIGYCFNQNMIFLGTIRDNITMGQTIEEDYLDYVLDKLNLKSYINKLPKGLQTKLNSEGKTISLAIRQKIQLARAIAQKPKLLLVEEAIHAIPEDEILEIISFIMQKERHCTVIIVGDSNYWNKHINQTIDL